MLQIGLRVEPWLAARRRVLGDAEQRLLSNALRERLGLDRSGDHASFAADSPITTEARDDCTTAVQPLILGIPVLCWRTKCRPPMETPPPLHELPPLNQRNHAITRFLLRRLQRHVGVRLRLHGLRTQLASGGGIIVANHFTRLETFAIPYVLYREARVLVRVLADPMFFTNTRVGTYLLSLGGLPTNYPQKYAAIARDILHGGWWLIFPEGSMIKDRKVLDRGSLQVSDA